MSLTAENIARNEIIDLYDEDHVMVRVKTSWHLGCCLPDEDGDSEETALFNVMKYGDNYIMEKAVSYDIDTGKKSYGEPITVQTTDIDEFKRLMIKRNLVEWSLDIPIERDRFGWMTPESYKRVSSIPAPLMAAFILKYEETMHISETEEKKISRQCALLFSKSGRGVTDACEAVSKFCTFGNFSEKFGIDRDKLAEIPYKEFLLLKIMIGKESDSLKSQQARSGNKGSSSKIIGQGGKSRASQGVKIALPGSGM